MDNINNPIPIALWVQFWFTSIILLGIWTLKGGVRRLVRINPFHEELSFNIVNLPFKVLISSLVASLPLFFSNGFSVLFYDFTGKEIPNIQNIYAILLTFIVNNFLIAYMALVTGGSRISPFSSLFFVLPTLGLFLRVPFWLISIYAVLVVLTYLILLPTRFYADGRDYQKALQIATVIIRITCLALVMFVAYFSLSYINKVIEANP